MKKYTLFFLIFAFTFTFFNINFTHAQSNTSFTSAQSASVSTAATAPSGCLTGDIFSRTTGQACSTAALAQCQTGDLFNSVTGKPCSVTATTSATATVTTTAPVASSVATSPTSVAFNRELSARLKSQGTDVTALQQFLKDEGYLFGNVDGKFGKITGRAVGDFQEDNDMTRTEIVDASTRALLNSKILTAKKSMPVISGVSGPQFLNVGQTGTWTVKASNPGGGDLSYLVNWGDEVNRLVGQRPSLTDSTGQSATFSHTYEEAGEYTPTFYVTNTSSQRAQTSLSVKVESVSTRIVSEQVKCVFEGSTKEQSCYTTNRTGRQYTFTGEGSAGGMVSGYKGEILTWKSSCGGYAYTTMDRQSDSAKFDCNTSSSSLNVLLPNGGETWTRGSTEIIAWQHNTTTSTNSFAAGTYDIRLFSYSVPCTSNICPMFFPAPSSYTIATRVYGSSYRWIVGDVWDKGIGPMDGIYGIEVCQTGTKICDASDSYFKLESKTNSQLSIVTSSIPDTKVGAGYAANIYAKGGNGESYYWRISSGSLPPGLSLFQDSIACIQAPCPNTGPAIIAGTPTAAGPYSFTVEVSAGRGPALIARQNFVVNVEAKSDTAGSLSIDPASVSLKAGNSSQVKAFYMPACPAGFACIQSIQEVNATWTVGNKSIADVMYAISDCNPTFAESGCVSRTYVSVYGISRGSTELSAVYQEKNGNHVKKTIMVTVE